ncbi:hypothetical protein EMCRGX_G028137 [Ephydatia muelleri]
MQDYGRQNLAFLAKLFLLGHLWHNTLNQSALSMDGTTQKCPTHTDVHCIGFHWRFHYPNPVLEFHLTHPHKAPSLLHHGQKVTSTVLSMTINPRWPEKRLPIDSTGTITLSVCNWQLDPALKIITNKPLTVITRWIHLLRGLQLVHSLTAGQHMGSPLIASGSIQLFWIDPSTAPDPSSILASDGHLGMDTAVSSSPGEPKEGPSSGDLPHNNESAAPAIIVSEPSGGEICGTVPVLDYLQLFIAEELDQILQRPTKYSRTILEQSCGIFAHTDWSLPSGWEKKIDPKTKKEVFIDHNAHFTMFLDPRLPYAGNGFQGCHSCSIRDTD